MPRTLIHMNPRDHVATALSPLAVGETHRYDSGEVTLLDPIPFGHKVALCDIPAGADVLRYGAPIGHATRDIRRGEHVHTHNLATNLGELLDYTYTPDLHFTPRPDGRTFSGYRRPDGRVGVRNEVWILPTVGCVNRTAQLLAERANRLFAGRCDGVIAFPHDQGCGQSGRSLEETRQLLRGLAQNPNAAAVLVLGLGCEHNVPGDFFDSLCQASDPARLRLLICQDHTDEYGAGLALLDELTRYAAQFHREPCGLEGLTLGLKCGGSDAFSGITANALCGRITDRVVSNGGTILLGEVPEMFGAETRLMARADSRETFDKIVVLINNFKRYFMRYGEVIYNNPSPGNKEGGITTLEEKSLGCIQKGGTAPVTDVLGFGEQPHKRGLHLVNSSGYDLVTCTNLAASGAVMLLFTTGRGTPFGGPVPTLKIASNSEAYRHKQNWFDFNAGIILEGHSFEEAADAFLAEILRCASGEQPSRCEETGNREIMIFKDGVTL